MQDLQSIRLLIGKIQHGLPDIKNRAISSIHSKITVGILQIGSLPKYNNLPGILLNWINDNMQKGEILFKVLTILQHYTKTQEGLVLLQKYQALDFFRSFKQFLLQKQPKNDHYTNILEQIIKQLLPLSPQTSTNTQIKTSAISQIKTINQNSIIKQKKQQKVDHKQKVGRQVIVDGIRMSWVVRRQLLQKKEQQQLYGLMMQLKHSKRQLHLQWLKRIQNIVQYWGYKWFKYRVQLINELTQQFQTSKFKWLIINILRWIIRGIGQNAIDLQDGNLDMVNLNANKQIFKPQKDKITLTFKYQLFQSIYSGFLIQDLIKYHQITKESNLYHCLLYMKFKYSWKYFYRGFKEVLTGQPKALIQDRLNHQISYYCANFQVFREEISQLINNSPEEWNLSPQHFPVLQHYLVDLQKSKSFNHLKGFDGQSWQLGSNLHLIQSILDKLSKGLQGIPSKGETNNYIKLYINSLLTLAVSVQKQDPLMIHYKTIKSFILKISQNADISINLYEQILRYFNKQQPLKYGNKNYSISDLATMIFSQETMYRQLFCSSLMNQQSIIYWLQITKRLIRNNNFYEIDNYTIIFYSLTYHKNQEIKNNSKFICQKLNKNGKSRLNMIKMFSKSQEERKRVCQELFTVNSRSILMQIQTPVVKAVVSTKKLLKISAQSLINYIQIILNHSLQEDIRISGAKQLLQTLSRLDLTNKSLQQLLTNFSQKILIILHQPQRISMTFLSIMLQLNNFLNKTLPNKYKLKIEDIFTFLQLNLPIKIIQLLLQNLYISLFQNPFQIIQQQIHFIQLLYPHIKIIEMPVSQIKVQNTKLVVNYEKKEDKIIMKKYQQTLEFQHFMEDVVFKIFNGINVVVNEVFIQIFQKQIGQILHANKGYVHLQYLAYGFHLIHQYQIKLPQKIIEYSSPILNNLLSKDQAPLNTIPTAQIISIIGFKKTRQIQAILQNNTAGLWKFYLLDKLQIIQPSLFEQIIKGLLGAGYGEETNHIINLILKNQHNIQLSMFSQTLILSSCIKLIKQQTDSLLRQSCFYLLIDIFGTSNLQCQTQQDLLSSIISILLQQNLTLNLSILGLLLIRKIIQINIIKQQQKNIIKILLNKLIPILSIYNSNKYLIGSLLQLINLIADKYKGQFLMQYQLVDTNMAIVDQIINNYNKVKDKGKDKNRDRDREQINCIIKQILRFLFIWIDVDQDLPKYLLTSTKILNNMLRLLECQVKGRYCSGILESIGILWIKLSQKQQDLFVYKLNQMMKVSIKPLFTILLSNIKQAGLQYLKMICWTLIISSRSSTQELDQQQIKQLSKMILSSKQPSLIKLILPFSLQSKIIFLNSNYIQQLLKINTNIIDNRIVKETKDKKKKGNKLSYQLEDKDRYKLIQFLSILTSFFYSQDRQDIVLDGNDSLRKIINFLEKFYSCGQWQEQISKLYIKIMTNLALCTPFSHFCSSRFSQNGIMMQQMLGCVSRSQQSDNNVKFSLKIISVLVHLQSIRNVVIRARIIQQLCQKLNKHEQKNDINVEYTMDILQLFIALSPYKDASIRLLSDKKVLDMLIRILRLGKFSIMEEKIVTLLSNLACFKANKPIFMSNRDIHKVILGLLQDQQITYHSSLLTLLYNIIYKNSAGLKLYRRAQVIEVIKRLRDKEPSEVAESLLQSLETIEMMP